MIKILMIIRIMFKGWRTRTSQWQAGTRNDAHKVSKRPSFLSHDCHYNHYRHHYDCHIMTHIFNNLGFYSSFVPSSAIITLFITIFLVKTTPIPPSKIIIIFFVSVLPPTESVVHQNDGNARSEFSVFISNSLQRNICFFLTKGPFVMR